MAMSDQEIKHYLRRLGRSKLVKARAAAMLEIVEAFASAFEGDDGLDRAMQLGIDAELVSARHVLGELAEFDAESVARYGSDWNKRR